jgi:integrase
MGSVYDRWDSEPERNGKGLRYVAVWRDESHRQRKKSFRLKGDARRFLRAIEHSRDLGMSANPSVGLVPFADYATDWLVKSVHLRAKTASDYESILRVHLVPAFGAVALNRLRATHATSLIVAMRSNGYQDSTLNKVLRLANTVLNAAVTEQRLPTNPFAAVRKPPETRRDLVVLSPGEFSHLLAMIHPHFRCFSFAAVVLGLRFGELAGLRPSNLDLGRRRIFVVEQLTKGPGGPSRGPLKTAASKRSVSIPKRLVDELADQLKHRASDDYVFTSLEGQPIRHSNFLRRHWHPATKDAGFDGLRFHDLRHACAAWSIAAGAPATLVQQRLGHASVSTTLNVYGHLLPGMDDRLAERLDATIAEVVVTRALPALPDEVRKGDAYGSNVGDELGLYRWARRDLNPRPPPCKGGALAS